MYKVEETITRFKCWVQKALCPGEEWEMQMRGRHILLRESHSLRLGTDGAIKVQEEKTLAFLLRFHNSSFRIYFLCLFYSVHIY